MKKKTENYKTKDKPSLNIVKLVIIIISVVIVLGIIVAIGQGQRVKSISLPSSFSVGKVDIKTCPIIEFDTPNEKSNEHLVDSNVHIAPLSFRLLQPNPTCISPLYGQFNIGIANVGNKKIVISEIKWKILDGTREITPPDEWRKIIGEPKVEQFYLAPKKGITYLYGPEIDPVKKNRITLGIEVKYSILQWFGKKRRVAYYAGMLEYDEDAKTYYTSKDFIGVIGNN
ncbi:MAG: hypothetical protein PHI58_03145 [Candidatus Omnitrophica bacterium]|nr:hypothetical protein [Candidatus Omnitrophota bacterium]